MHRQRRYARGEPFPARAVQRSRPAGIRERAIVLQGLANCRLEQIVDSRDVFVSQCSLLSWLPDFHVGSGLRIGYGIGRAAAAQAPTT